MFFYLKTVNLLLENWFLSLISYEIRTLYKVFKVTQELHMKYLLISFIFLVGCPGKNASLKTEGTPLDAANKDAANKDVATGTTADNGVTGGSISSATPGSQGGPAAAPLVPVAIATTSSNFSCTEVGYKVSKSGVKICVSAEEFKNSSILVPQGQKFVEVKVDFSQLKLKELLTTPLSKEPTSDKKATVAKGFENSVSAKISTTYSATIPANKRQTDTMPVTQDANQVVDIAVEPLNYRVAYGLGCCPVTQIACDVGTKGKVSDCAMLKSASLNAITNSALISYANMVRLDARAADPQNQYAFTCEQK